MQWLLHDKRVATVLPNIYNEEQLREFAATSSTPGLLDEEMKRVDDLVQSGFGLEREEGKFKGSMELPPTLAHCSCLT